MQYELQWQTVEKAFEADRTVIVRALILGRRLNLAESLQAIEQRSGVTLAPAALRAELRTIVTRASVHDLRGRKTELIPLFYGQTSMRVFLSTRSPFMSCQEIAEVILKDTGISITRKGIWSVAKRLGVKTQELREAFNRAVDKKRVDHNRIAAKIDYTRRKTDYGSFQSKRLLHQGDCPRDLNLFAFGLKAIMRQKKVTHRAVASALGVSEKCVHAWCALNNRVSPQYWDRLCQLLETRPTLIFNAEATAPQRRKIADKTR